MTEYSNAINCSRTFRGILVIGNKKSLGLTAKRIKLNSETDHFRTIIEGTNFTHPLNYINRHLCKKDIARPLTIDIKTCY